MQQKEYTMLAWIKKQSKKKKNKKKGIALYNVGPILMFLMFSAAIIKLLTTCPLFK